MKLKNGAHKFLIRRIIINLNENFKTFSIYPQVIISKIFHVGPKFFDPLGAYKGPTRLLGTRE